MTLWLHWLTSCRFLPQANSRRLLLVASRTSSQYSTKRSHSTWQARQRRFSFKDQRRTSQWPNQSFTGRSFIMRMMSRVQQVCQRLHQNPAAPVGLSPRPKKYWILYVVIRIAESASSTRPHRASFLSAVLHVGTRDAVHM
jgi:hypothetical protein